MEKVADLLQKAPSKRELSPPAAATEGVFSLAYSLRHGFAVPPPSEREAFFAFL